MFWEVWRNVALAATSSWGLGGGNTNNKVTGLSSSKSSKKSHRYKQLMSSSTSLSNTSCGTPLPKKSVSQPVNLANCAQKNDKNGNNINDDCTQPEPASHVPPNHADFNNSSKSQGKSECGGGGGGGGGVRHSLSSFLPFNSCTFYGIMVKSKSTNCNQTKDNKKENILSGNNTKSSDEDFLNGNQSANFLEEQQKHNNNNNNPSTTTDYWEDDDDFELPTCDVCARIFPTVRQLAAHQRKKRHYGCIQCDSIFPSREVLECHREQMCHYEFAIDMFDVDEQNLDDEQDFFDSDDDDADYRMGIRDKDEDWLEEEMERLL